MEKYKIKDFVRWAKKEHILDEMLLKLIEEMDQGLVGDRLGSNIYKKRLGIHGRGKRGGGRVIVLYKQKEIIVFLYGYRKNEQESLSLMEENQLRIFATAFMKFSSEKRKSLKMNGKLFEIKE